MIQRLHNGESELSLRFTDNEGLLSVLMRWYPSYGFSEGHKKSSSAPASRQNVTSWGLMWVNLEAWTPSPIWKKKKSLTRASGNSETITKDLLESQKKQRNKTKVKKKKSSNFQNLAKDKLTDLRSWVNIKSKNTKKSTPRQILVKLLKTKFKPKKSQR